MGTGAMNTDQMREEKRQLFEAKQAIFTKWNGLATARWYYYDKGIQDTQANEMFERMSNDMDVLWADYEKLTNQWCEIDLQLVALERAAMDVPKVQSAPKFAPGTHTLLVKPGSRPVTLPDPESRPVTTLEHAAAREADYDAVWTWMTNDAAKSWRAEIVDAAVREDAQHGS